MEYFSVHIEKLHIYDLLESGILDNYFTLVTCIDSDCDVLKIIKKHQAGEMQPEIAYRPLGTAAIFDGIKLKKAAEKYNLFNGFDEIWCFKKTPIFEKPQAVIICGVEIIETDNIIQWMQSSGCVMAAGDGLGLNYITCDPYIDNFLRSI